MKLNIQPLILKLVQLLDKLFQRFKFKKVIFSFILSLSGPAGKLTIKTFDLGVSARLWTTSLGFQRDSFGIAHVSVGDVCVDLCCFFLLFSLCFSDPLLFKVLKSQDFCQFLKFVGSPSRHWAEISGSLIQLLFRCTDLVLLKAIAGWNHYDT